MYLSAATGDLARDYGHVIKRRTSRKIELGSSHICVEKSDFR